MYHICYMSLVILGDSANQDFAGVILHHATKNFGQCYSLYTCSFSNLRLGGFVSDLFHSGTDG